MEQGTRLYDSEIAVKLRSNLVSLKLCFEKLFRNLFAAY